MRSIAIDMGNTRAKAALFENQQLLVLEAGMAPAQLAGWCRQQGAGHAIVASVGAAAEPVVQELSDFLEVFMLQPQLPQPLKIRYQTPHSLGADRIAAAVGGAARFKGKPVLVFDAGTCLTHELVNAQDEYLGGAISPGLHMRLRAMHEFTARLPLATLNSEALPELPGQSTMQCLESGAFWGMLGEIENTILRYREIYPDLQVILCGGDAKIF